MGCLTHPGWDKQAVAAEAETEALAGAEATRFRAVAARANYLFGIGLISNTPSRRFAEDGKTREGRLGKVGQVGKVRERGSKVCPVLRVAE